MGGSRARPTQGIEGQGIEGPPPPHLHRLLQDVLRRDVDLGNDEEDGNLRERGGKEDKEIQRRHRGRGVRSRGGGLREEKPKAGNVKSCKGEAGTHLEGQGDTHVLLAHPDDSHVRSDDEARVVGHMAWAARGAGWGG